MVDAITNCTIVWGGATCDIKTLEEHIFIRRTGTGFSLFHFGIYCLGWKVI